MSARRHLGERNVHRREHHPQPVRPEHHRHVVHAAEMREEIRVSAPRQPGRGERFLVDRRRGDGGHAILAARRRRPGRSRRTPHAQSRRSRVRPEIAASSAAVCGPYKRGLHAATTRGSRAAFTAISGPMPDGSPTVTAMTGRDMGSRRQRGPPGRCYIVTATQSATIFGEALRAERVLRLGDGAEGVGQAARRRRPATAGAGCPRDRHWRARRTRRPTARRDRG